MSTLSIQRREVINKARISLPMPEIDYAYILWLGSIAMAVMASACFISMGVNYLVDSYIAMKTGVRSYDPSTYHKLMGMTFILSLMTFLMRYADNRIKAYRAAITMYQLSERISAVPDDSAGGGVSTFEISCTVKLGLYRDEVVASMDNLERGIINLMNQSLKEALGDESEFKGSPQR